MAGAACRWPGCSPWPTARPRGRLDRRGDGERGDLWQRVRDGFALTDPGTSLVGGLGEAHYCIICHEQGKDSCSKGLKEKPDESGRAAFRKSPFGVPLPGCPLEERISEFHKLKTEAVPIGALSLRTRGFFFLMVTLAFGQMAYSFVFQSPKVPSKSDSYFMRSCSNLFC